jgi:ketosteroid isomerase-like protein
MLLSLLIPVFILISSTTQAQNTDESAILDVIQTLFVSMETQDDQLARTVFIPTATFLNTIETPDGLRTVSYNVDDHISNMARTSGISEEIWDPIIRIHGKIAMAWTPFKLRVNQNFASCGINIFSLVNTNDGWKISHIIFTTERTGCDDLRNHRENTLLEFTQILHDFLEGASRNDRDTHERFWADDLIYTSSDGLRFGKDTIMNGFDDEPSESTSEPTTIYTAEDIQIQLYDQMAIVAYKMKGETKTKNGPEISYYLNSGTFVKRNNRWQVVNWHATRTAP